MPELTVIFWRDIPAQVTAGKGRGAARAQLSERFQEAIDAAAMRAGLIGTDDVPRGVAPRGPALRRRPRGRGGGGRRPARARLPRRETRAARPCERRRGARVTETVLSSATKEVVIGFDRPFVVIGERINPTGRKKLAEEMKAGNFETVIADAIAQVEAGAQMLDVNAGIPLADEPAILRQTIELVQSITDVPLSIDSSIVEALEAGLSVYQGKALVNSVTGEDEQMERVLPLVAKYGAAVVAISNDETGISEDPDVRFEVARKIVSRAADYGIPREDIVVDPLVMPIGAMGTAGRQVFRLVRRLQDELKVNSTCGASNVSFGLPNRPALNAAFLPMAIASGLTSAITSPLARRGAARDLGGRRDERERRALRHLDRPQRRLGRGGADRPPRRPRRQAEGGGRVSSPGDHRAPRRLHAVRAARPLRSRHDRARRRPAARGRHRLRLRRPRHLRALPGRGERGRAREARDHLVRRPPLADRRGRARVRRRQGPRAAPPARLHRPRRGRARDRRAAREPGAPAGRAQGGRRPPDRDQPRRPALLRRGRGARPRLAVERSRPPARGARARVGADRARRSTTTSSRACRRRLRTGRVEGHRRGARRHRPDRGLARLPRHLVRDRLRHRLDHGRRAPLRPRAPARCSPRPAR